MRADLHIHTTASDGSWGPEKAISKAAEAGIGFCAITDHDTVKNIIPARQAAKAAGMAFLAGVEMSTTVGGNTFHILGYGIDPAHPLLRRVLLHNTALLEEVDQISVKKLIADGLKIDYAEYCAYQHDPARGGWKSLSFLIDKGICKDVADFFEHIFVAERGLAFPVYPPPEEVIEAIKSAGGVPVLAHPGSEFHGPVLEETLDYFGGVEIEGIECFHPGHDVSTVKRILAWCGRYGLLVTGGSDCHGDFVPHRRLGVPEIHLAQLRLGRLEGKICSS